MKGFGRLNVYIHGSSAHICIIHGRCGKHKMGGRDGLFSLCSSYYFSVLSTSAYRVGVILSLSSVIYSGIFHPGDALLASPVF